MTTTTSTHSDNAPTIQFRLIGNEPSGRTVTILDGWTIHSGVTCRLHDGTSLRDFIRQVAASAARAGATNIRVLFSRHTRALGWSSDRAYLTGRRPYRVVRIGA